MFRIVGITLGLLGAVALAAGCGDDDSNGKLDTGAIKIDGGTTTTDSYVPPTTDSYVPPQVDQGGGGPSANTGAICNATTPCTDSNDNCILLQGASQTNGMCLSTCNQAGDTCPVTNSATQLSMCALQDATTMQAYCAYLCEVQGQTYSCPSDTEFDCVAVDPTQPSIKVCVPL